MHTTEKSAENAVESRRLVYYAGVGSNLVRYDVDVENAALILAGTVEGLGNAQYDGCQHTSKNIFYVASSDRPPGKTSNPGKNHYLTAFLIDQSTGELRRHGTPLALKHHPISISVDGTSAYLLVAYAHPSGLTVHRINPDGGIGTEITQDASLDVGIYAHQIRVAPANDVAILVTRGNDATSTKPEDPGAIKIFKYRDGLLSDGVSIAPGGGYGFGPRHLDFHPAQPWIYVTLERQNKLYMFSLIDGVLSAAPLFSKDTLAEPGNRRQRQMSGTVHVHPSGRFVYIAERATIDIEGTSDSVYKGGENTLVAFEINSTTGEPVFLQRVNTRGLHPRTFSIDPSGRILIVSSKSPVFLKEGEAASRIPASLDVFHIGQDGKLQFIRQHAVDVGEASINWSSLVHL